MKRHKPSPYPELVAPASKFRSMTALLIVALIVGVGGFFGIRAIFAATTPIPVSGRVYDTRTGQGVANVPIFGCTSHNLTFSAKTDGNGNWGFSVPSGYYYCARVLGGIPSGWAGPATNNRPNHSGATTYENQVAGTDCYNNQATLCNGNAQSWDRYSDASVDFRYTSPTPPTPQPPNPAPQPTPTPSPVTKKPSTKSPSPSIPGSTADTVAPAKPGNFKADLADGVVNLSWDAAFDSSGIDHYTLERSLDQTVWESMDDNIKDTNYTDSSVGYGATYYYRLKAVDPSGNGSDFATVQVATGAFSANSSGDQPTIIKSDDNVITVTIPTDALEQAADCTIVTDSDKSGGLPLKKSALVAGPYNLLCKQANGTIVTDFKAAVTVETKLTADQLKRYKGFTFYGYSNNNWTKVKVSYNKKTKTYSFNTNKAVVFAVLGKVKKGLSGQAIILIIMFLLALGGVAYYLYRRAQKANYQEYIRKKYYNL